MHTHVFPAYPWSVDPCAASCRVRFVHEFESADEYHEGKRIVSQAFFTHTHTRTHTHTHARTHTTTVRYTPVLLPAVVIYAVAAGGKRKRKSRSPQDFPKGTPIKPDYVYQVLDKTKSSLSRTVRVSGCA